MPKYNYRIIQAGSTIEIIEYGRPVLGKVELEKTYRSGRSKDASEVEKIINRYKVMRRARTDLRRLIQANSRQWKDIHGIVYLPIFLTLTFAKNIMDFETANHEFKLFIMRLGNRIGGRTERNCLQYVVVPEFQKRGAIHYHLIIFNLPYIRQRELSDIWRNGRVHIKAIDEVDNVGAYVCKYMGKDLDDERLRGKKCYFSSRGLFKPEIMEIDTDNPGQKKMLESVLQTAQALAKKEPYKVEYPSEYFESIKYTQYTI